MGVEVNYLSVLLAAVVSMVLGFLWYGPILGKPWMKEKGLTPEKLKKAQKEMGKLYGLSFVVSLVTGYVLFHIMTLSIAYFNYPQLHTGLISAFWVWLGFMMPVQLTATIFGEKNWKLFGIDTGYQLVSVLGMGVVLGLL
jgi:dipeptide/tripeptide permease